ncbi:dihydrolipoyl dehydrogenase [Bordetella genomosp. 7]|uniref:Dihydrolipoyl dehydrogenase n=1 Tax=Bordetella genomosp. 7 TaxID=1416805 RepID=A0A261R025_9BORD|nr:dihydrolipoyl dehydrogenase [Bordetella genomosp. 7]OZI17992.1 dihydrolipoyl dehydrogenase [Bordetella genomosp. 7]OZI21786.1 dihydrolipoyl dehydrogenase [Bordetella genomosp. 7]
MSDTRSTTLLIIGGGPGGYVAAIRAGQLGVPVTLVEGLHPGGTCLNIGCIPSKALIHAAQEFERAREYAQDSPLGITVQAPAIDIARTVAWKDGIVRRLTGGVQALLKKSGVQLVRGWARVLDGKTVEVDTGEGPVRIQCEHLLLAAGSEPMPLPSMPFGDKVISSTEALSPASIPRRLVVVGAGYIGLELGTVYRKLGAQVTVVEAQDRILPTYDAELTKPVAGALERMGIELCLGRKVMGLNAAGDAVRVQDATGAETALPADQVLLAIGRRPRTQGWGLENLQLDRAGNALRIDDQCRTSMRNVWAIGDIAGEPMLAHRAMAQGEMVAELVAGQRRRFAPAAIPAVCFTDPEIVTAGLAPSQAQQAGLDCTSAIFPFAANGRAMTLESTDGFVRVVARRDNHLIVGWQAVGRGVSELAAAFGQSLEMSARLEDVAGTIHAHPTLGEAVQEAALRALGQALHI